MPGNDLRQTCRALCWRWKPQALRFLHHKWNNLPTNNLRFILTLGIEMMKSAWKRYGFLENWSKCRARNRSHRLVIEREKWWPSPAWWHEAMHCRGRRSSKLIGGRLAITRSYLFAAENRYQTRWHMMLWPIFAVIWRRRHLQFIRRHNVAYPHRKAQSPLSRILPNTTRAYKLWHRYCRHREIWAGSLT